MLCFVAFWLKSIRPENVRSSRGANFFLSFFVSLFIFIFFVLNFLRGDIDVYHGSADISVSGTKI